jgi:prepilin-type N-terminal cleavage/methylation domain-containing protein
MNLSKHTSIRRGFTLIELLVVIAIIGILVGLLVPAVMNFMKKGPIIITTNEIGQLDTALQTFKQEYNITYIPSQIKLCELQGSYGSTQLDLDSISYLTQLWPKITSQDPATGAVRWATTGIDWNGDGTISPGGVILEGHQCLVFFLGGVPSRGTSLTCGGFATDPRDPIKLSQSTGRKGPYFDAFSSSGRLGLWPSQGGTAGFFSYFDPYSQLSPPVAPGDKPYAFFSSYGQPNGYNFNKYPPLGSISGDCPSLGVTPYYQSGSTGPQYYNPKSHQIISAGADRTFGPGSLPPGGATWTPQTAGSIAAAGRDDQSNFSGGALMGVGN